MEILSRRFSEHLSERHKEMIVRVAKDFDAKGKLNDLDHLLYIIDAVVEVYGNDQAEAAKRREFWERAAASALNRRGTEADRAAKLADDLFEEWDRRFGKIVPVPEVLWLEDHNSRANGRYRQQRRARTDAATATARRTEAALEA